MFERLSTKLIAGFSFILTLSIIVNFFAIYKLSQVQEVAVEISENWMPSIYEISSINTNTSDHMIRQQQHIFALSETEMAGYEAEMRELEMQIAESEQKYRAFLDERQEKLREMGDIYEEDDSKESKAMRQIIKNRSDFELYEESYNKYLELSKKVQRDSRYNNKEQAKQTLMLTAALSFEESNQNLDFIIAQDLQNAREAAERSEEIYTDSSRLIIGGTIFSILVSFAVALFIVRNTSKKIGGDPSEIADIARRVSAGDLNMKFNNNKSEESIYSSVRKVVENLKEISNITNSIAKGDLSRRVEVKSPNDLLAISINQMIENFKNIINQAQVIAKGDYTVEVKERGEEDELSTALQRMTESLRANKKETFEQNWIKDGINQLAQQLSGNLLSLELSRKAINFISRYTDSAQGVMYLVDNFSSKLKLNASYAFTERSGLSNEYKIGEGLVGQVALERSPILLKNIRRQDMALTTGTVEEPPTHVYAFPLVFEYELYGVIELASFEPFTQLKQEFLQQAANTIVTYIYSVSQTDRIKGLLATSEEATRSAQARAKEIEQANERLEIQQGELQEKSEELRRRNESLILAKEELDRRAEELELSNKYKSEFLANMSHELRTPLNSIIMLSKMLSKNEKRSLPEKDVKKAKIIYKSGGELLRLINDILDLSKIEAGKMVINPVEFTNKEIVTDMSDLFQGIAQEKGIDFITEDKTKSFIYSDKERLAQILRNFLSNSFKFTKKGQVKLTITEHDENHYKYSISDTGIGIPKDKQQVIFEAFKQADGTTSREYGGTGLGLSIARELTKLLQGQIELDSEAGKGSTFSIILPKRLDEELAEKEDRVTVVVKNLDAKRGTASQKRLPRKLIREDIDDDRDNINKNDNVILIIEDEVQFAESMAEVLSAQSIKTLIAQSGEEGIDLAIQYKPNGIILDLGLPDIDGVDVLKKLKSYKELRHIPIEIISARDKDHNLLSTGAFGFLQKPIDENVLKSAMSDMLRLSKKKVKELLIVEDDESQMEAIKELIIGDDVKVLGVKSQDEAIQAIENGTFDGAIVDLGLKDGSGQAVCKYINENHSNIPVIIYTGKSLSHEEETNLRQAAQSIILKTRDTDEKLREEVAIFLHRMEEEVEKETPKQDEFSSSNGQKSRTAQLAESLLDELKVDKELEEMISKKSSSKTGRKKPTEKLEGDVPPRSLTRNSINEEISEDEDDIEEQKAADEAGGEISKEEAIKIIKNKTILVVDDDIRNIFVIASALETYEAQILEAMNGQQAIDMLREEDVDLVLMDSVMPEMNGLDAMRKIRQDEELKHYPIVAITGKAQEEDKQECFDAGANGYIVKPVDYDQLVYTVCKWIGKRV
ncbi:response regulator [Bernardetia sp.]|uniref:response regulator n=1 Tax=Bernardetia sp. TaxID=1937974 RepID=UPI0025C0208E|nr:response regulator [Bernardetia sp.]